MRYFLTRNILLAWLGMVIWLVAVRVGGVPALRWGTEILYLVFISWMFYQSREVFLWSDELPIRRRLAGLGQISGLLIVTAALLVVQMSKEAGEAAAAQAASSFGSQLAFGVLQGVLLLLIGCAAVILASLVFHEAGTAWKVISGVMCGVLLLGSCLLSSGDGWMWLIVLALVPSFRTSWTEDFSAKLKTAIFFFGFVIFFLLALFQAKVTWSGVEQYLLPVLEVEMGRFPAGLTRAVLLLLVAHVVLFQLKMIFSPMTRVAALRGGLRTKLILFYVAAGAIPLILMVLILSIGFYIVLGGYRASLAKKLAADYAETCLDLSERVARDPGILRWARTVPLEPGAVATDQEISEQLSAWVAEEELGAGVGYVLVQVQADSSRLVARSDGTPAQRAPGYWIPDWSVDASRAGLVPALENVWGRGVTGLALGDRRLLVEVGVALDLVFLDRMKRLTGVDFELSNGYWLHLTVARGQVTAHRGEAPEGLEVKPEWRSISTMAPDDPRSESFLDRRLYFGGAFLPEIDWTTGETVEKIAGMLLIRTSIRNLYKVLFAPENTINMLLLVVVGILAVLFLVITLVAAGVGVRVVRNITRSVGALKKGTQRVRAGDFDYRIHLTSRDEFEDLAESFNVMSAEVRRMLIAVQEKEKLEAELRIARSIQERLLPQEQPRLPGFEVLGSSMSAREVGGDYFDFISFDAGSWGVAVGDVSGKGVTAALLMANLQAGLRAFASKPSQIAGVMERLNLQLLRTTAAEMYATFFYGVLDSRTQVFSFSNAGHNPPLLVRANGTTELLDAGGLPLGMMEGFPYEEAKVEMAPGDLLVLYTDGVTEAENAQGDQLGDDGFLEVVVSSRGEGVQAVQERIHEAVREFAAGHEQSDDLTLVIVKCTV